MDVTWLVNWCHFNLFATCWLNFSCMPAPVCFMKNACPCLSVITQNSDEAQRWRLWMGCISDTMFALVCHLLLSWKSRFNRAWLQASWWFQSLSLSCLQTFYICKGNNNNNGFWIVMFLLSRCPIPFFSGQPHQLRWRTILKNSLVSVESKKTCSALCALELPVLSSCNILYIIVMIITAEPEWNYSVRLFCSINTSQHSRVEKRPLCDL